MNDIFGTIRYAFARRPVRVVEAVIVLAGALGLVLDPDAAAAILTLVGLVFVGGEVAQTQTTSAKYPKLDDGHGGDAL